MYGASSCQRPHRPCLVLQIWGPIALAAKLIFKRRVTRIMTFHQPSSSRDHTRMMSDNWLAYPVPRGEYVHDRTYGIDPRPPVDELEFQYVLRPWYPFFPLELGPRGPGAILKHDEDMFELLGAKYIDIYVKWPTGDPRGMRKTVSLIRTSGKNKGAHLTRVELAAYIADRVASHLRCIERPCNTPGPPPHPWTIGGHNGYSIHDIFVVAIRKVFPENKIYWVDLAVPFLMHQLVYKNGIGRSMWIYDAPKDSDSNNKSESQYHMNFLVPDVRWEVS